MKSWIGKRVFVTGGTGFIGANIVRRLVREKAEVVLLVRPNAHLWRLKGILPKMSLIQGDLTRANDVEKAVSQVCPHAIFHLATFRANKNPTTFSNFVTTNLFGATHLAVAAKKANVQIFVSAGSQLEYGNTLKPHRESDLLRPVTLYGLTRAASTMYFQYAAQELGLPIVVLRLFHVYGPWESHERLIPTAIRAALTGARLPMTEQGFHRDYVFVEDVVEAFLAAAARPDLGGEIFNIGSGVQTSNEEALAIIERVTGKVISSQIGAYKKHLHDTIFRVADIRKAGDILGWRPRYTLDKGIRKTAEWVRAQ